MTLKSKKVEAADAAPTPVAKDVVNDVASQLNVGETRKERHINRTIFILDIVKEILKWLKF